jgi:hypothetical protein
MSMLQSRTMRSDTRFVITRPREAEPDITWRPFQTEKLTFEVISAI